MSIQTDLSVGEPVKNLEKLEPIELEELIPKTIRMMPAARAARERILFMVPFEGLLNNRDVINDPINPVEVADEFGGEILLGVRPSRASE
jgi:hypothetical protein